jgi:hypothetical protein
MFQWWNTCTSLRSKRQSNTCIFSYEIITLNVTLLSFTRHCPAVPHRLLHKWVNESASILSKFSQVKMTLHNGWIEFSLSPRASRKLLSRGPVIPVLDSSTVSSGHCDREDCCSRLANSIFVMFLLWDTFNVLNDLDWTTPLENVTKVWIKADLRPIFLQMYKTSVFYSFNDRRYFEEITKSDETHPKVERFWK